MRNRHTQFALSSRHDFSALAKWIEALDVRQLTILPNLVIIFLLAFTSNSFGQAWPYGDPLNPPSIIYGQGGYWERIGAGVDQRGVASSPTEADFWRYGGGSDWKGMISGSFNSFGTQPAGVTLNQEIYRAPGVQGPWVVNVYPAGFYGNAGGNGYHQAMIPGGSPPPVVNPYTLTTTRMYMVALRIKVPIWAPDYMSGGYYISGYQDVDMSFGVTVPISTVPYRWIYQ